MDAAAAAPPIVSVAPMMDWTDRHCRYFHRLLAPDIRLYTEMISARAILSGDAERLLAFDPVEHPVAVQLGGSDPDELARASTIAAAFGYDEINLNVGCPSPRVSAADFGACLMKDPVLVGELLVAMREAVTVPVTVKHRIGVDDRDDYAFLLRFVATVAAAGIGSVIVHARKALLAGLSPKQNRSVPPLMYRRVYRLKADFPQLRVIINGGIDSVAAAREHLRHVDGVMLGRRAYEEPLLLSRLQHEILNPALDRGWRPPVPAEIIEAMARYAGAQAADGVRLRHISRHMLGLFHGQPGARAWRRYLSDPARDGSDPAAALRASLALVEAGRRSAGSAPISLGDSAAR